MLKADPITKVRSGALRPCRFMLTSGRISTSKMSVLCTAHMLKNENSCHIHPRDLFPETASDSELR
jgi:hypothetical protein